MKKQFIGGLLFGLALLILGVILWAARELFVFQWLFSKIAETITTEAGINAWLARAMAAFLGLFITYSLYLAFSRGKSRSTRVWIGVTLSAVIIIGYSLSMYEITKDHFFMPDGTPIKCYTRLLDGKLIFTECVRKMHEVYGTPVLPVTADTMLEYETQKNGVPEAQAFVSKKNTRFFSFDGKPLVWYFKYPDGKIELFSTPGHHPQLNAALSPITPEIAEELRGMRRAGKTDQLIVNNDRSLERLLEDLESW